MECLKMVSEALWLFPLQITNPGSITGDYEPNLDELNVTSSTDEENEDNYEEIESLLDQALPDELKNKKKDYEERFKTIMDGW